MENNIEKKFPINKFLIAFIVLAGFGFIDASYLSVSHFLNTTLHCSIIEGCDVVTSSVYSQIGPIPIALLGALYYLAIVLLSIFSLDKKSMAAAKFVSRVTWLGFLFSIYLVYIQFFILNSICPYCLGSALISITLFILGMLLLKNLKRWE